MRRLLSNTMIQAFLLVLTMVIFQLLLATNSSGFEVSFWYMAFVAWMVFFAGFWLYQRFFNFWRQRHRLFPFIYGIVIVAAYTSYLWAFYAKYPIFGRLPLASWHPWLFLLAGLAMSVMFAPSLLTLNRLLEQRLLLRAGLGFIVVAILAYPYFLRGKVEPAKPHLLLRLETPQQPIDLQGFRIHAKQMSDQVMCSERDIALWQSAPVFAPFYWFVTSPFSSQLLCIEVGTLDEADLADFRWDQRVLLIWRRPDWESLLGLIPKLNQVFLQVGSDESRMLHLDYGDPEDVHSQSSHE